MGIRDFNTLTLTEKHLILRKEGQFVDSCQYESYYVALYKVDSMLVELYYNVDTGSFDSISVATTDDLWKYVDKISLNELFGTH